MNRWARVLIAPVAVTALVRCTPTVGDDSPLASPPPDAMTASETVPRPERDPIIFQDLAEMSSNAPLMRVTLPIADGNSDGIAVVRWQVFDNPTVIANFFHEHPPTAIDSSKIKQLASNGLLVAQVELDAIPDALEKLGGTYANIRAWLGQATDWHQLTALPIRGSLATVVNGSTRHLSDGSLQLLMRGWTVPLEAGAVTDIEILPVFSPGGRVPGARATVREPITSAGLFASLPRGSALLITGMAPKSARAQSAHGPSAGPPATHPRTLGELLLTHVSDESQLIPQRPLVIIIPLLPAHHFPLDAPVDSAPTEPQ
ncbi:MAG: hypothetical protein EXS17_07825 [Phycisphaerales bacterium]|nr:hypothetical protein [Phycisphaerales bacterium]